ADAAHAARAYVELLGEIERRRLAAVPSLKLTHLGLDLGEATCRVNLEAVLARGRASATLVWIDMESTAYTERALDLSARVRPAPVILRARKGSRASDSRSRCSTGSGATCTHALPRTGSGSGCSSRTARTGMATSCGGSPSGRRTSPSSSVSFFVTRGWSAPSPLE